MVDTEKKEDRTDERSTDEGRKLFEKMIRRTPSDEFSRLWDEIVMRPIMEKEKEDKLALTDKELEIISKQIEYRKLIYDSHSRRK
jgi:hypothetical protein